MSINVRSLKKCLQSPKKELAARHPICLVKARRTINCPKLYCRFNAMTISALDQSRIRLPLEAQVAKEIMVNSRLLVNGRSQLCNELYTVSERINDEVSFYSPQELLFAPRAAMCVPWA